MTVRQKMGIWLTLCLASLTACGTAEEMAPPPSVKEVEEAAAPAPASELVGQGQAMAESLCAGCHAIGLTGDSPNPEAMPFRQISWHYPVEMLAESLAEGIMVAHPKMPQWQFEPEQIDALLAYLETVQVPKEE